MSKACNFYLFTGKGGVGKTTLALSFSRYLASKKINYLHVSIKNFSLNKKTYSDDSVEKLTAQLGLNYLALDLEQSCIKYMAKKLKSPTVAGWIAKTPFFRALINMIPSIGYLVYLGQLLELIEQSKGELIIVLDAPSSGHFLSMLESIKNFQNIFQTGAIFEDTQKMIDILTRPDFMQIFIASIPSELALTEALELEESIKQLGPYRCNILLNHSLSEYKAEEMAHAPEFLLNRWQFENHLNHENFIYIPYISSNSQLQISEDLLHYMDKLFISAD
jgi:arsenite-transporting ATPase